jgi:hypothetical protein
MELPQESLIAHHQHWTRRHFLRDCSAGLGALWMTLQGRAGAPSVIRNLAQPFAEIPSPFRAKAKRVIYLHMAGAPSQLELFDYKPELARFDGKTCPQKYLEGKRFAFIQGIPKLLGPRYPFAQHGQTGAWISDRLPHFAQVADQVCFVKSLHTDQFNHAPAQLAMHTGYSTPGYPSMGSWVTYGLGSSNENLPGFIVLLSGGKTPDAGKSAWGSGFLPSVYQGVQCRSQGDPVLYVSDPPGMDRKTRRRSLDALKDLNELQAHELGNAETLTRIAQYELAYRMQTSVPEVMDISREPAHVLAAYGAQPGGASLANNCLLARRLLEQGVRFVHLFDWGWDFHGTGPGEDIRDGLTKKAATFDKPAAALIEDLEQRGLLEDTLILCTGEFGRTPFREGRTAGGSILGRDHFPDCYSIWMAGGGVKGGLTYGASDDLGFRVAENPVHVHDLQATILHLLGFDHTKLTWRFQGRDFRLTDVHGTVVGGLLA